MSTPEEVALYAAQLIARGSLSVRDAQRYAKDVQFREYRKRERAARAAARSPKPPNPPAAEPHPCSTGFQPVGATPEAECLAESGKSSAATSFARVENPCHVGSVNAVIQKDTNPPLSDALDEPDPDIREFDVNGELSPRQLNAIDLLVSGRNDRITAEMVGVKRVTITRWRLYHLAFRAAMSRRRKETFGTASDRLRSMLHKAIDVLEELLASEDPKVQMAAIRLMISLSKQCSLQPPDDPESSREILEGEARKYRAMRLAKNEADQVADEDDRDEALARLKRRNADCMTQETPAPREKKEAVEEPTAIQKDTNGDVTGADASPPPPVLRGRAGEGAPANGVNCETNGVDCETNDAASPSPLPNPPPEYRGRGQEECRERGSHDAAIQNDTDSATPKSPEDRVTRG